MQKKHGFAPLGAADGPVKSAIFGFIDPAWEHLKPIGQIVDQRVHRRIDDVQDHPSRPYNGARHYHLDLRAAMNDMPFDGIAKQKAAYLENGVSPSNAAYGYVLKTG